MSSHSHTLTADIMVALRRILYKKKTFFFYFSMKIDNVWFCCRISCHVCVRCVGVHTVTT